MKKTARKFLKFSVANLSAAALCLIVGLGVPSGARADEADARKLLKAMSDYMAAQKAISVQYDTILEIVTKDKQKLGLASSGKSRSIGLTRFASRAPAGLRMSSLFLTGKP